MVGQVYSFHPETADAFPHTWAQEQFYFNQTHTKRWWKGSSCADPLLVDKRTLSPVKLRITWILDTQGCSYTNPNIFFAYSRLFSIGMSLMSLSRTYAWTDVQFFMLILQHFLCLENIQGKENESSVPFKQEGDSTKDVYPPKIVSLYNQTMDEKLIWKIWVGKSSTILWVYDDPRN